ncbi:MULTISPECIES: tRNA uridine-5-carboxymethylaminomethyl(34) synthesis GTPase MnmE [unclassified Paenibacillus]|uniref:tRNA uridine-5-carboxymethylaminomethyl(34) synthesis GTPase MnmE n=1 Tax=unclassified Paenibacillus TaxID=185978 RepID=UPI001045CFF3|nr:MULTISPECIES: tRNA uridine-5-carboxymethylaminomethyl(34) synthesis GTPase MnmE [unclassified Paenibacillus]NIK71478.1 tRNA modification GTPase [Paenibacillus sp. BK720]TCM96805.1 tRNA modification GTPase [Paenibacillus sp. BK033]
MVHDTIAAISTAVGEGGIAIIRVSGPDAIEGTARIFRSRTDLRDAATHTVHYGHIIDPKNGEQVEEVIVTVMRGPRSFTAEDVVEINAHGGVVAVKKVLDQVLLQEGMRLAEPGEFTKRAFLNGRIDLMQAEAVIDLIRSKSDRAFSVARKQAEGTLSKRIKALRQTVIELLAHIEVNIDYPEHDVEDLTSAYIREQSGSALEEIGRLLKTANEGKILREGIMTAIVGRPNVGKSSLLNMLAQENKAIVTDIPGTTRDVIEEYVTLNHIPLRLLDTAGIRETSDVVERIGVERSHNALEEADLILFVLNNNEPIHEDDRALLEKVKDRQLILIINKSDLESKLEMAEIEALIDEERIVRMSVREEEGLDRLEKAISKLFFEGQLDSGDLTYVSNVRHISLLKRAQQSLTDAIDASNAGIPIDLIQIDVRSAWESLGEILGDEVGDSLIDQIFSQFCLGK